MGNLYSIVRSIAVGVMAALLIEIVALQPFRVSGESMEPNFQNNERVIIDKITPKFADYKHGDVIVFLLKDTERGPEHLIKRIVALPNERIMIINRAITIYSAEHPDGLTLDESRYRPRITREQPVDVQLQSDEYFVLGDNRAMSKDSEIFGPIPKSAIVGRVLIRYFPFEKMSVY